MFQATLSKLTEWELNYAKSIKIHLTLITKKKEKILHQDKLQRDTADRSPDINDSHAKIKLDWNDAMTDKYGKKKYNVPLLGGQRKIVGAFFQFQNKIV